MKKTIREMILEAAEKLNSGQPGPQARRAKPADRGGDPERPNRAEETVFPSGWRFTGTSGLCRIVGFIPLSRGSNSGLSASNQAA
jgi:hypothetical protein